MQVKAYGIDGKRLQTLIAGECYKLDFLVVQSIEGSFSYFGPFKIEFVANRRTRIISVPPPPIRSSSIIDWEKIKLSGESGEELAALFECPVCLVSMKPPLTQCTNGHIICIDCRARMSMCPYCRRPIGTARNMALERIYYMLSNED